jgi:uncharacterized protein (TIGR00251 family)
VPLRTAKDGVLVAIRLQPSAGANRIDGVDAAADGGRRLRVRVTAAPENGKANKALIKLLAKAWRVPPSTIELAGGAKDRNKLLLVRGEPDGLHADLAAWIANLTTKT